jgi:NADH-quinone oxidoreductase subunit J
VLARRRGGLEAADEAELPRIDIRLPEGTGSMKEGVGDINPTASIDPRAMLTPATGEPTPEERG